MENAFTTLGQVTATTPSDSFYTTVSFPQRTEEDIVRDAVQHVVSFAQADMEVLNTQLKTMFDAAIPNKDQNRALKQMVDEKFSHVLDRLRGFANSKLSAAKASQPIQLIP